MRIIPGNDHWRTEGWVMRINGPTRATEYLNAFFLPFNRVGIRLSSQGDKALKFCALLAIPPPPSGIVAEDVTLLPYLEAVEPEQLSKVVLGLAEAALTMPRTLCPHGWMVVEELLPELERLTGIPKCNWCLHPSNRCPCPTALADRPPSYHQATSGIPQGAPAMRLPAGRGGQSLGTSHSQPAPAYPTPIMGSQPEDPPPMWTLPLAEQGLVRPTIDPSSHRTGTGLPPVPPPGQLEPPPVIPPLMSLTLTSGLSVTFASSTPTRDSTASSGQPVRSSTQGESQGRGQTPLETTQVGSSQTED